MPVKVRAQDPLRKAMDNEASIEVAADSVCGVISQLLRLYPAVRPRLLDDQGRIRRFVNIYVNEEDIRFLQNQHTAVKDGDEISIIPATSGG